MQAIVIGHANILRAITALRKNSTHPILSAQIPEDPIQDQRFVHSANIWNFLCTLPDTYLFYALWQSTVREYQNFSGGSWICPAGGGLSSASCKFTGSYLHFLIAYCAWSSLLVLVTHLFCMLASPPVVSLPGEFYCAPVCIGFKALLGVWRSSLLWTFLFQLMLSSPF